MDIGPFNLTLDLDRTELLVKIDFDPLDLDPAPGHVEKIKGHANLISSHSDDAGEAFSELNSVTDHLVGTSWTGQAATAFEKSATRTSKVISLYGDCADEVASALNTYAAKLEEFQNEADRERSKFINAAAEIGSGLKQIVILQVLEVKELAEYAAALAAEKAQDLDVFNISRAEAGLERRKRKAYDDVVEVHQKLAHQCRDVNSAFQRLHEAESALDNISEDRYQAEIVCKHAIDDSIPSEFRPSRIPDPVSWFTSGEYDAGDLLEALGDIDQPVGNTPKSPPGTYEEEVTDLSLDLAAGGLIYTGGGSIKGTRTRLSDGTYLVDVELCGEAGVEVAVGAGVGSRAKDNTSAKFGAGAQASAGASVERCYSVRFHVDNAAEALRLGAQIATRNLHLLPMPVSISTSVAAKGGASASAGVSAGPAGADVGASLNGAVGVKATLNMDGTSSLSGYIELEGSISGKLGVGKDLQAQLQGGVGAQVTVNSGANGLPTSVSVTCEVTYSNVHDAGIGSGQTVTERVTYELPVNGQLAQRVASLVQNPVANRGALVDIVQSGTLTTEKWVNDSSSVGAGGKAALGVQVKLEGGVSAGHGTLIERKVYENSNN